MTAAQHIAQTGPDYEIRIRSIHALNPVTILIFMTRQYRGKISIYDVVLLERDGVVHELDAVLSNFERVLLEQNPARALTLKWVQL